MLLRIGLGAPGKVLLKPFMTKLYCAAMAALALRKMSLG
jgi:hypothetical protein